MKKLTESTLPHRLIARGGILREPSFYKTLIALSLPIMLQNLLASSLSFIDTLMIGQLGEVEIAAVGIANQMFFLVILIFFGISSGASIFFSQFWGSKDLKSIHKTMGLAMSFGLLGSSVISVLSVGFPNQVMGVFSQDAEVISIGSQYLRIVGISYVFTAITFINSFALRSTGNPKLPLLVSAISMTTNALFNYLLIFGKFGFPAMGVRGAAIATAASRGLELFLLLLLSHTKKKPTAAPIRDYFSFDRTFVKKFLYTVTPVIFNEIFWSLGMVMYKVVFARMGTGIIASANITEAINSLFFVIFIGTGNGTAILIGNKIGEKKQEEAKNYASGALVFGFILGFGVGILMSVSAPFIPLLYNVTPEIRSLATRSLLVLALLFPIKVYNMHMIVGVLRSGGDTRFCLILEMIGVWLIGVPLAFIGGFLLNLPVYIIYLLVGSEEVFKLFFGRSRFKTGRWLNDLTHNN